MRIPITDQILMDSTAVIPDGVGDVESVDLGGTYYTENLPVVKEQIAKAGYRSVLLPP
jgi:hypothetical protein